MDGTVLILVVWHCNTTLRNPPEIIMDIRSCEFGVIIITAHFGRN